MHRINLASSPILSTPHLTLRQLSPDDASALSALRSDPRVNKYIVRPSQCSMDDAKEFILRINNDIAQGKCFYWAISAREHSELIGTICLWNFSANRTSAEIGYELNPDYHGKGLMSEAVNAIIKFSEDILKLNTLDAFVHKENSSSIKLLGKNGFMPTTRKDEKNPDFIIYNRSSANAV